MDENELREVMDAKLGGSYEVQMLHSTSESTYTPPSALEDAVEVESETQVEVTIYPDSTPTATADLRKLEDAVDGLHLQDSTVQEYLGGEVEVHATFVLLERTVSFSPEPPSFVSAGGESGAEDEEEGSPREGQIDVESAHTATLRFYREDGHDDTTHVLREAGGGGACDHDHGGTAVADISEQYDDLRAFLEDDRLCRECGAILVHQFNLPPGRVPGTLRRWADG